LNRELNLIQERNLESFVTNAVSLARGFEDRGIAVRLVGSGCTSLVNYLLGLSGVDSIRFCLPHQRFWTTNDGEAPTFLFIADLDEDAFAHRLPGLIVHKMTRLETIPFRLSAFDFPENDDATFNQISTGNTDGVFQLDNDAVKEIAANVRPATLRDLATVTALAMRQVSDPGFVDDFLKEREERPSRNDTADINTFRQLLFQEELMTALHDTLGFCWSESYLFVRDADRKRGLGVDHPLYQKTLKGASSTGMGDMQNRWLLDKLVRESQSAVCLAHHLANAVTTYRAAFLKTHFAAKFAEQLEDVTTAA
jgi:DNA polymerase III alpha subunit